MRPAGRRVLGQELTGDAPIMVLAPHSDDETLGCGGLLAHAFAHQGAHVVCMTDGSGSHPGSMDWPPARLAAERQRELIAAVECLGGDASDVSFLGHRDGWLGAGDREKIADTLVDLHKRRGSGRVFAPWEGDHHEDHKSTADIALRMRARMTGLELFSYPVWGRWDNPDFDASVAALDPVVLSTVPFRERKRQAMQAHATQLGQRIDDDPKGFVLPDGFITTFTEGDEIFWKVPE